MVKRVFMTREIRPTPVFLYETNHIWAVTSPLGAVTFETAMMFEAEIDGEKVKQWGDAHLLTHWPRDQMSEGLELLGGWPLSSCPILETECWTNTVDASAWDLKLAWQAAQFDDEIIYSALEDIIKKWS